MRAEAHVESRDLATELPPLLVLVLGSIALVLSLAFALLGGGLAFETFDSIVFAGKLVLITLSVSVIALIAALLRPRPEEVLAIATPAGLTLQGKRSRTFPAASIRHVLLLEEGGDWVVEVERRHSLTRLRLQDGKAARRLAGALVGKEKLEPVVSRVRRRASYYLFVGTCSLWIVVYAALCALPIVPVIGVLLSAVLIPLAAWVTLRAIPAQVVVAPDGFSILHPLGNRTHPLDAIQKLEVVDDGCVLLRLRNGELESVPELAEHPRSPSPAGLPPAECLGQAAEQLLGTATPQIA